MLALDLKRLYVSVLKGDRMVKYFASCYATEQLLLAASLTKGFQWPTTESIER